MEIHQARPSQNTRRLRAGEMITDLENETYSKIKAFDLEFDGEDLY